MAGENLTDLPELRELFLAYQQLASPGRALPNLHHACVRFGEPDLEWLLSNSSSPDSHSPFRSFGTQMTPSDPQPWWSAPQRSSPERSYT